MSKVLRFSFVILALLGLIVWSLAASPPQVVKAEFIGSDACLNCHGEQILTDYTHTVHFGVEQNAQMELEKNMCEACHGPGSAHAENTEDYGLLLTFNAKKSEESPDQWNEACLKCHEKGMQMHWTGSMHESRGLACVNCHTLMKNVSEENQLAKPTEAEVCFACHKMKKMQFQKSSHMPLMEGKVTCIDCHNPHGSPNPSQLVEGSANENCLKCHAEKGGPKLWEHPPVTENCLNCHNPHGSNHDNLLVVKRPRLCQRCHAEARHPSTPRTPSEAFVFNLGCTNCHSQIHGSNHPSGMLFVR